MTPLLALAPLLVAVVAGADPILLARIEALLAHEDVIGGEFVQRIEVAALSRPIESSGRFYLDAGGAIAWYVDRPVTTSAFIDAAGAIHGAADGSSAPDLESVAQLVRALMRGDIDWLASRFETQAQVAEPAWRIALVPEAPPFDRFITRVRMQGANFVDEVVLETQPGDLVTIRFANVTVLDALPANVAADLDFGN